MKNIALICDNNYINWISYLIKIDQSKNFYYIFCTNTLIKIELDKIIKNNFKTFLFIKNYNKKYSARHINKIENNLGCSFIEIKKSIYAYDEIFKSCNFLINEIKSNIIDQYLCNVYYNLQNFFINNKVNLFFLEQESGLISFIINNLCKKYKIKCLIFYEIYFPNSFLILNSFNYSPVSKNLTINFKKIKEKFKYLKKNHFSSNEIEWQSNYERRNKFFNVIKNKRNLLDTSFFDLNIFERIIIKLKKINFYFFFKKICIQDLPKNYAVYYLSYQPEASTYGFGSVRTNQLQLIKEIRQNLNQNIHLIIKEHPEQLRKIPRKLSFYFEILRLKNTHFISENFNKKLLLKNSKLIFSISGTISLEAALIEKKVIVFSKLIHSIFKKNINYVDNLKNMRNIIVNTLKSKPTKIYISDFKKFIYLFLDGELFFKHKKNKKAAYSIKDFLIKFN